MKFIFGILICQQLMTQILAVASDLPACAEQDFVITVDNDFVLYVDGSEVKDLPNAGEYRKTDTVKLPAVTQVVAIKGIDYGLAAGILASGENFRSGSSWKCTGTYSDGWESASFDDSSWPAAKTIYRNGSGNWGLKFSDISDDAYWIWTTSRKHGGPNSDKVVYCRARLPACLNCEVIGIV